MEKIQKAQKEFHASNYHFPLRDKYRDDCIKVICKFQVNKISSMKFKKSIKEMRSVFYVGFIIFIRPQKVGWSVKYKVPNQKIEGLENKAKKGSIQFWFSFLTFDFDIHANFQYTVTTAWNIWGKYVNYISVHP